MADVAFDIVQVSRLAAPLSPVEWHDLHESSCTNEASCARVEVVGLDEHHADEQRWIDLLLPAFCDDSVSNSIRDFPIPRVVPKDLADAESILTRTRRADDGARELYERRGLREGGVLLLKSPYCASSKQNTEHECLSYCPEVSAEA
jgi:hypothetical protein